MRVNQALSRRATGLAVPLLVLLSACGSSGGSSGGSTSSAAANHDPYIVGLNDGLTSAGTAAYASSMLNALKAYFAPINNSGGIKGHQVQVIALDNKGLAATSSSNFTSLVESSNASIVIGSIVSSIGDVDVQRANQLQVPFLASSPDTNIVSQPYGFSSGLALPQSADFEIGYLKSVASSGDIASIVVKSSAGNEFGQRIAQLASQNGFSVKTSQTWPLPPPDTMQPQAQAIKSSGATYVVGGVSDGGGVDTLLVHDLQTLGFQGQVLNFFGGNSLTTLRSLNVPWYKVVQPFSYPTESSPGVKKYVSTLQANGGDPNGIFSPIGWVMGAIITNAFTHCGFPCKGPQMKAALEKLGNIGTLDGFAAGPIALSSSNHQAIHYAKMYAYQNGAATPISKAFAAQWP